MLISWLLFFFLAMPTEAQQTRSFTLEPKAIGSVARPGILTQAELRTLYRDRLARVDAHHIELPLPISDTPLSDEIRNPATAIKPRVRESEFGSGVRIRTLASVTGTAGIDYRHASPVSEPTVAVRGEEVLVTGNWYAALSTDGGKTFTPLLPNELFGTPAVGGGFCCDQVAIYDRDTDAMFWLMQGSANAAGNSFRLLVARGNDIRAQNWQVYDIPVTQAFPSGGVWFDFPDMALSDRHLYISTNVFTLKTPEEPRPRWVAASIIRLPKQGLANYASLETNLWTSTERGSFRFAQGSRERMFWASHRSNSELAVQRWGAGEAEPSPPVTIAVETWMRPTKETVGSALAKNGKPWLKRLGESNGGRITAGWRANGYLGFGWTAGADNRFPFVHARVALIEEDKVMGWTGPLPLRPNAQPHIWSSTKAFAYPAAAPNARGDVAVSVAFGGPSHFPSYAVGVLTATGADSGEPWRWGLTVAREGLNTPYCPMPIMQSSGEIEYRFDRECGKWGDYFSVRVHGAEPNTWATVGFTIRSTGANELLKAEAEFFWFENFGGPEAAARARSAATPAAQRSRQ